MATDRKKFLCVCQGGNVRSAALKNILNYEYGQDALACSGQKNSPETLALLVGWADWVVLMSQEVHDSYWPQGLDACGKVVIVDVGPDVFGSPFHPELCEFLRAVVGLWEARDWQLQAPCRITDQRRHVEVPA